jgi:glycerol-3-phosphate acyltransferase PlsY
MIITLNPQLAMIAVVVFLLFFLTTGYVSLGSMMAGISMPILFIRTYGMEQWSVAVFSIAVAILVVFTHRKNIKRLAKGEENRAKIFHRPNQNNRLA